MEILKKKGGCLKWGLVGVVILLLLFVIGKISSDKNVSSETEQLTAETSAPEPIKKGWIIDETVDEMTDAKTIIAAVQSVNYISQEFPYDGKTYASIYVRHSKKKGYDVLIGISKGQINGSEYSGTNYITARFDEGTAKKYYYDEAADGSSELVFLKNKTEFVKQCKSATSIKIDIPLYQAGRPVFTFVVDEPLTMPEE